MARKICLIAPSSSTGIRHFTEELAGALNSLNLDVVVSEHKMRDRACHFHLGNSTRSLLPSIFSVRESALVTLHDVIPRNVALSRIFAKPVARLLKRHSVVVHGEYSRTLLRSLGCRNDIHVIHLGAQIREYDQEELAKTRREISSTAEFIFVIAGILKSQKGVGDIFSAANLFPSILFLFLGKLADSKTRALFSSAPSNVLHIPSPPYEDFLRLIAASDVLLNFRRRSVGEASGPTVQAHAVGTKVAGYDVGTFAEYCGDYDFVFPPDVPVSAALQSVLQQKQKLRQSVSSRGLGVTTLQEAAQSYFDLYKKLKWAS